MTSRAAHLRHRRYLGGNSVLLGAADEGIGLSAMKPKKQVSCLPCLIVLVTVSLLPFLVLLVLYNTNCAEKPFKPMVSPSGRYIAQVVFIGCGGATEGFDSIEVRLRPAGADPDSRGQTIVNLGPSSYGLSLYWEYWGEEESLIIEHYCEYRRASGKRWRWRDVPIRYHCVDSSKAHLCNACRLCPYC